MGIEPTSGSSQDARALGSSESLCTYYRPCEGPTARGRTQPSSRLVWSGLACPCLVWPLLVWSGLDPRRCTRGRAHGAAAVPQGFCPLRAATAAAHPWCLWRGCGTAQRARARNGRVRPQNVCRGPICARPRGRRRIAASAPAAAREGRGPAALYAFVALLSFGHKL